MMYLEFVSFIENIVAMENELPLIWLMYCDEMHICTHQRQIYIWMLVADSFESEEDYHYI